MSAYWNKKVFLNFLHQELKNKKSPETDCNIYTQY